GPRRPYQPALPCGATRRPGRGADPDSGPAGCRRRGLHPGQRARRERRRLRGLPLGRGRQGHPDLVERSDRRRLVPGWADDPGLRAERAEPGMTGNGARAVEPVAGPLDATVVVPGSKSVTNRALVCAGLAGGVSTLTGALVADDTEAMVDCLRRLGIAV